MKKEIKLYNAFFPVWLIMLSPKILLIVLPANFAIDFFVIFLSSKYLKLSDSSKIAKENVIKTWIFGFIADIVGAIILLHSPIIVNAFGYSSWWMKNIANAIFGNPFSSIYSFIFACACVIISGFLIYVLNYHCNFKYNDLTEKQKKAICLALAVFTAPVLFFLPPSLLYGW